LAITVSWRDRMVGQEFNLGAAELGDDPQLLPIGRRQGHLHLRRSEGPRRTPVYELQDAVLVLVERLHTERGADDAQALSAVWACVTDFSDRH
jgi:hypothetical protein